MIPALLLAAAVATPTIPNDDCVRINEAHRIAAEVGEDLWPGWKTAPFAILLVTANHEFLIDHPRPGDTFEDTGVDRRLGTHVFVRDRVFNPAMLATFPVDGVPTIVIGEPKRTAASHTTRWTLTLLHEHLHQWQQSRQDYYEATGQLGLAEGDTTGMWMLNFPFPYDDENVNVLFTAMCRKLRDAVADGGSASFGDYLSAREALQQALSDKDYKYFSFQLWQEGVARYTEYALARRAAARYRPSEAFTAFEDYTSFEDDAKQTADHIMNELNAMSLRKARRTAFYQVGAAEAMLLDRHVPQWREHYFTEKFFLEKYYRDADSVD
jgi:hypothetical protein